MNESCVDVLFNCKGYQCINVFYYVPHIRSFGGVCDFLVRWMWVRIVFKKGKEKPLISVVAIFDASV